MRRLSVMSAVTMCVVAVGIVTVPVIAVTMCIGNQDRFLKLAALGAEPRVQQVV